MEIVVTSSVVAYRYTELPRDSFTLRLCDSYTSPKKLSFTRIKNDLYLNEVIH